MISKEVNMGGNVFGLRGNIIVVISMYASHIFFKSGVIDLAALETFIQVR